MKAVAFLLVLTLAAPRLTAAPPASFDDLLPDLIARIAAAIAPSDRVQVMAAGDSALRAVLARGLGARGIQIAEGASGVPAVRIACSTNLRERVCTADITKAGTVQTLFATGAIVPGAASDAPVAMLDTHHIFSQPAAMLDVAVIGDRLIVLDPMALTLYQRSGNGWQKRRSQPIVTSRVWPRDLRGRLRIAGSSLDAYLPGVVCRATLDSFNVSCADERQPWPVPIDNTGIAGGRNYFTTPEGLTFYAAAPLGPESGARWLLVGDRARLMLVDDGRRALDAAVGEADDVAGVTGCDGGAFVLLSSRGESNDGRDVLRLVRLADRRLVQAAPSLVMPGAVAALWPATAPAGAAVTAIVRDLSSERYDAIQIDVACGR